MHPLSLIVIRTSPYFKFQPRYCMFTDPSEPRSLWISIRKVSSVDSPTRPLIFPRRGRGSDQTYLCVLYKSPVWKFYTVESHAFRYWGFLPNESCTSPQGSRTYSDMPTRLSLTRLSHFCVVGRD